MRKKKKSLLTTILLVFILLVGLSVMLYPTVRNWWNIKVQTRDIATYDKAVSNFDDSEKMKMVSDAWNYNYQLAKLPFPFEQYDQIEGYAEMLDVSGTGIMGYVTIPSIQVNLPIYHGTSEEVLNVAAGHLQGSSIPIGGANCHAVISAHRGLPSAKLFSDLDRVCVGDLFTITILAVFFITLE